MSRGTGYGWLDIAWTDGPTEPAVMELTARFQSARFDSTADSYQPMLPELYLIDGVPTEIRYHCRGISTARTYSPDAREWAQRHAQPGTDSWHRAERLGYPDTADLATRILLEETNLTS